MIQFVLEQGMAMDGIRRFADVSVKANDNRSLQDLYNSEEVKTQVRNSFNNETFQAVLNGEVELVLNHKNHTTERHCQQLPVKTLDKVSVVDLIASIPRDNKGPLDGAAFPVTLCFGTRDIITSELDKG